MKVGDLIEANHGEIGVVIGRVMMYPGNPHSPVGRVKVYWQTEPPEWSRSGVLYSVFAIKRVVSEGR